MKRHLSSDKWLADENKVFIEICVSVFNWGYERHCNTVSLGGHVR